MKVKLKLKETMIKGNDSIDNKRYVVETGIEKPGAYYDVMGAVDVIIYNQEIVDSREEAIGLADDFDNKGKNYGYARVYEYDGGLTNEEIEERFSTGDLIYYVSEDKLQEGLSDDEMTITHDYSYHR